MSTLKNFALIELNSGFVWWVGEAEKPTDACMRADANIDQPRGDYAEISAGEIRSTAGGYAVHVAPVGFDVQDGQDREAIAAVSAMPLSGYFRLIGD